MITITMPFLPSFGEKNWRISPKTNLRSFFAKTGISLSKKRQFVCQIFGQKYF
jgi:hypothetical protein